MRAESRLQFYQQVINKWNRDAASVVRDLQNYLGGGGVVSGQPRNPLDTPLHGYFWLEYYGHHVFIPENASHLKVKCMSRDEA